MMYQEVRASQEGERLLDCSGIHLISGRNGSDFIRSGS